MPYGLSGAPSVFQCLINDVLRDFLGKFVVANIDDILIYLPDFENHVDQVKQILTKSREKCKYVKVQIP